MNTMACHHRLADGSECNGFRGATVHHIEGGHAFQEEPERLERLEPAAATLSTTLPDGTVLAERIVRSTEDWSADPRPPANLREMVNRER